MNKYEFYETSLSGAFVIKNFSLADSRGSFTKSYEKEEFSNYGIQFSLSETFYTSSDFNVIRGLHFQKKNPQTKIVSVVNGIIWDVIVDLRPDSNTYKKWIGVELSAKNALSLYVPRGFAHGFLSKENNTIVLYQCDGKYDAETDSGILYNDIDIAIEWPVDLSMTVHSERDLRLETLREYERNPMIL